MRTGQRGQALPLGLALILFGVLGGFALYNTGQSATDKARVVNAADSAAYSGILWQARALNFQAYTNRAMVANQVSMAQAVSLRSWIAYGKVTAENISTVLAPIPVVGQVATGVSRVMAGVERVAEPAAEAMLGVVDTINVGIGAAQQGMFLSSFAATPEIVSAVATSSDERFTADTAYSLLGAVGNLEDWRGFTRRVGTDDERGMGERADMIMASRDAFSANRDWSLFGSPLYLIPFQWRIDIEREGRTELIRSADGAGWEWKAKDTVSIHNELNSWIRGWKGQEVPLGWAQAYANSVGDGGAFAGPVAAGGTIERGACTDPRQFRRFSGHGCRQWFDDNDLAETFSDVGVPGIGGAASRIDMNGYSGINPFRDLSADAIAEDFPTLRLKVEVALPLDRTESTDNTVATDPFATGMSAPGNRFSSISVSEVFFKPPHADREGAADTQLEFANAYSPYWDARLAPIPQSERLAAFALRDHRGGGVVPGGVSVPDGAPAMPGAGAAGGLAAYAGAAVDPLRDAVAAELAEIDMGAIERQVRHQLAGALGRAARDMLGGVVGDGADIASREDLVIWADGRGQDLRTEAGQVRDDHEHEMGALRAQQAEFERIADAVTQGMVELVRQRLAENGVEERELLATVGVVDGDVDAAGEPLPLPSAAELDTARERLAGLEGELVDELTDELVLRVNAAATTYRMPRDVAESTVRMLLRDLRRAPSDEPDWDPFGIEGRVGALTPAPSRASA